MKNMRMRDKLLASFGALIVCILITGAVSYRNMQELDVGVNLLSYVNASLSEAQSAQSSLLQYSLGGR